jgi:tripartite-type tricarboxylate transporter receptor subunit TctC
MVNRISLIATLLATFAAGLPVQVAAQSQTRADFPSRPVRLITLTAPGGALDVTARTIASRLSERLGQPFVVENRPGASGNIGLDMVAKAQPDGYTIGTCTTSTHGINPALYGSRMPFDPLRDFAPISTIAELNNVIVVHPSIPARSIRELVEYSRSNPGKLSFGSSGTGSSQHLGGEMLKGMAGIDMQHIPYKGLAQAIPDILSGQISLIFSSIPDALPHIRSGKLRALAVTSKRKADLLPDVTPVSQQGYPDYNVRGWFGLVAPAGTPGEIVNIYNREIVQAMAQGEARNRLVSIGLDPVTMSPEQFAGFIREEISSWTAVVRSSGARAE